MGNSNTNKGNLEEPYCWQKISTEKELCGFDPRFEDICFASSSSSSSYSYSQILVGDMKNRIFCFELNKISQLFEMKTILTYNDESGGDRVAKQFDREGETLTWNSQQKYVHCWKRREGLMYKLNCDEWLRDVYQNETAWFSDKQCINLGQGIVLMIIGHHHIDNSTQIFYDLCQVNVIDGKIISKVTIQTDMFYEKKANPQHWGFQYNSKYNCVSLIVMSKAKKEQLCHTVLIISLKEGKIIWQYSCQFIHDTAFNPDGVYFAIFERPQSTNVGYTHVLNVARLEWVCRVKLEYGPLPLGWDAFAWCADSLIFFAPYAMSVLTPEEMESEKKEKKKLSSKVSENTVVGLDQSAPTTQQTTVPQGSTTVEQSTQPTEPQNPTTRQAPEEAYKKIVEMMKNREICVLGISKRWWDCETSTLEVLTTLTESDNTSKIILEYAGFSWAILQFQFPPMDGDLQGAMTEVLKSGHIDNQNYLLMSKMDRDSTTKITSNNWVFYITKMPNNFYQMWDIAKVYGKDLKSRVRCGVLGSQDKPLPEIFL